METIMKALKSRTLWTIVAMFLVGGLEAIRSAIPHPGVVELFLALIAGYYKLNPSQKY